MRVLVALHGLSQERVREIAKKLRSELPLSLGKTNPPVQIKVLPSDYAQLRGLQLADGIAFEAARYGAEVVIVQDGETAMTTLGTVRLVAWAVGEPVIIGAYQNPGAFVAKLYLPNGTSIRIAG